MHLAEGILPATDAAIWAGVSAPFLVFSGSRLRQLKASEDPVKRAFFGLAVALCFAVSLFPIPVPVAGATSHMCATPLLALIYGPGLLSIPVGAVLAIQALFFAHGGLTTLGANVCTMGIIGPFAAYGLARLLVWLRLPSAVAVAVSCFIAGLTVYVADAAILAWALHADTSAWSLFKTTIVGFLPTQLPLCVLEAIMSLLIIRALARRQLPLVPSWLSGLEKAQAVQLTKPHKSAISVLIPLLNLIGSTVVPLASIPAFGASSFPGLDDILFSRLAAEAGHPERPLFPWLTGEVELSAFSLGFFLCGLYVGSRWQLLKTQWIDRRVN